MRVPFLFATLGLAFGLPVSAQETTQADAQTDTSAPASPVAEADIGEVSCPVSGPDAAVSPPALPVQDYEPAPAMWKIADDDTTIYLFGTYHVLPKGFRWRTPLLDKVIRETDEVVFESRDDDEEVDEELTLERIQLLTLIQKYRAEVPLSRRISERNRPKLLKLLKDAEIPLSRVEYLPPMMTMFGIAIAMYEASGSESQYGVETVIEKEYRANNRPISAIEDPIQVLENLFQIDEATLIAAIDEGLDEWDGCKFFASEEHDWSGEHAWARGKLDDELWDESFDDPFSKSFYRVLLIDRNREWAKWVKERMDRPGNLLLAVGAGHMEGPDSLVLMLEADGVSVERVQ